MYGFISGYIVLLEYVELITFLMTMIMIQTNDDNNSGELIVDRDSGNLVNPFMRVTN